MGRPKDGRERGRAFVRACALRTACMHPIEAWAGPGRGGRSHAVAVADHGRYRIPDHTLDL
jgi:hypothetical protein